MLLVLYSLTPKYFGNAYSSSTSVLIIAQFSVSMKGIVIFSPLQICPIYDNGVKEAYI